jgi:UDP-N-acetylglucosamine 2-epimerase
MRTVSIIGARPQFIKIAPGCRAIERFNARGGEQIDDLIVHTGQHYDEAMSAIFFDELRIPRPAVNLEVGSGSHAEQSAKMLMGLEKVIQQSEPNAVVVYGDTNSTLAGALAAAKLCVPVAHIEAGLRSFNRRMPEEINRIVADHVSDVLYGPTQTAMENLRNEGRGAHSVLSGDVMLDAVEFNRTLLDDSQTLRNLGLKSNEYVLVTVHRAENTSQEVLGDLLALLNEIAEDYRPVIFPMHPRTKNILLQGGQRWHTSERLHVVDPIGYLENLFLIEHARLVLTDSGGLQKEAFFLGTPCITLREETDWPETVSGGGNSIVGTERSAVLGALTAWESKIAAGRIDFAAAAREQFGNGRASDVIVEHLAAFCAARAGK